MLDGLSAKQAVEKLGFKVIADEGQLLELVRKAIAANPKAVADIIWIPYQPVTKENYKTFMK